MNNLQESMKSITASLYLFQKFTKGLLATCKV